MPDSAVSSRPSVALASLVGADLEVPTESGPAHYVNLDYAATAPALVAVTDAVTAALPTYGSVHRGAGFASVVSTEAYASARARVAAFLACRPDDHVIFTRNTTDSLNLLAAAVPAGTTVFGFPSEHHANLLPWRRNAYVSLGFPTSAADAVGRLRDALANRAGGPALVAVTGASNVTGELWPVAELTTVAHAHGARIVVDAAQLAPHRPIDVTTTDIDYVAFSGHKLYAPFGAGVLAGRGDWLDAATPHLDGGGAVERVWEDRVDWLSGPARHEAGTPNLLGAVAVAAACDALDGIGWDRIAEHEDELTALVVEGLRDLGGIDVLTLWGAGAPRIGVTSFAVRGLPSGVVAAHLAERGIAVRNGSFCAHLLVDHLLEGSFGGGCDSGGAVRVSVGLGTTSDDVDRFLAALATLPR